MYHPVLNVVYKNRIKEVCLHIQQGDHVYSMKKRETSSPGPTIHEIHPSEIMDEVHIIDAPVMEVTADVPVVYVLLSGNCDC